MPNPFFTIGHSTRSVEEFVGLLRAADVRLVVDVRTMPRSRRMPQFNADGLPIALADVGIDYEHVHALGGLRSPSRDLVNRRRRARATEPIPHAAKRGCCNCVLIVA
jgi:uncharacterized protein (DUF488 family)